MFKSLQKRMLSGILALIMMLGLCAYMPTCANEAHAAGMSVSGKTAITAGKTSTYSIKNVKKTQYVKVSVSKDVRDYVRVQYNKKTIKYSTKVYGTGKTLKITVRANKAIIDEDFTLTIATYNKSTKKLVKRIKLPISVLEGKKVVKATGLTVTGPKTEINEGEQTVLTATVVPADADKTGLTWTSSDTSVATVSNGVVTGIKEGVAVITASLGTLSVVKEIKVNALNKEATAVSAKVVGAKKIELSFNGTINDKAMKVTIKRGYTTLIQSGLTFKAGIATFTAVTNITKGDYSVVVTGATKNTLTCTFTVANDPVVSEIRIENPKAALVADGARFAKVTFKTFDQYGEPIKATGITWQTTGQPICDKNGKELKSVNTDANGVGEFYIQSTKAFSIGDTLTVTGLYMNGANVATCPATLITIGAGAKLDKISVVGVVDTKTNKLVELPAGFEKDRYVLAIIGIDQYGSETTLVDANKDNKWDNLTIVSEAPQLIDASELGKNVTVNGKTYQTIKLTPGALANKGGKANVLFVGNLTGTRVDYEISVPEKSEVAKFTLEDPGKMVSLGDSIYLSYVALDQKGNKITKYNDLVGKVTFQGATLEKAADGTARVKYEAKDVAPTAQSDAIAIVYSTVIKTGDISYVQIRVGMPAVPTYIISMSDKVLKDIIVGGSITVGYKDFVFIDQYGNTMTTDAVTKWHNQNPSKNVLKVATILDNKPVSLVGAKNENNYSVAYMTGNNVTLKGVMPEGGVTSQYFTFTLVNNGVEALETAFNASFNVVTAKDFVKYEVGTIGTFYDQQTKSINHNYDVKVPVYGVTIAGNKVLLPYSDEYYTMTVSGTKGITAKNGVLSQNTEKLFSDIEYSTGLNKVTVKINIIDAKTGAYVLSKDISLSVKKDAPKATTYKFSDKVKASGSTYVATLTASAGSISNNAFKALITSFVDQYGVAMSNPTIYYKISKATKTCDTFKVVGNGTTSCGVTGAQEGDEFTLTITSGSVSVDIVITVA